MAQNMAATLPHRSNAPVTEFAEETKKVAKKVAKIRQHVDDAQIAELEAKQAPQVGEEQPAEQATPKAPSITQQREALKAAGLKRCPSHLRLLDRLPDDSKIAVEGHAVDIRPIAEFQKNTSVCRHCDHLIQRDWRAAHAVVPDTSKKQRATLAKLIEQRDALTVKIDGFTALLNAQAGSHDERA